MTTGHSRPYMRSSAEVDGSVPDKRKGSRVVVPVGQSTVPPVLLNRPVSYACNVLVVVAVLAARVGLAAPRRAVVFECVSYS